jgi:hypothetical protein
MIHGRSFAFTLNSGGSKPASKDLYPKLFPTNPSA